MTRTLFLHVGSGKAGSTTIQQHISHMYETGNSVRPVACFGIPNATHLVAASGGKISHKFFVENRGLMSEEEFKANAHGLWEKAKLEVQDLDETRFVSSSEFLMHKVHDELIRTMRDQLATVFDDIKIIIYLREQKSFIRSLWAQNVHGFRKSSLTFPQFMNTIMRRRRQWDYRFILTPWVDVFGAEAIEASVFDPKAFVGGDLLRDFCSKIGADYDPSPTADHSKQNVSPSDDELEQIRYRNQVEQALRLGQEAPDPMRSGENHVEGYDERVLSLVSDGNHWVNDTLLASKTVKLPVL